MYAFGRFPKYALAEGLYKKYTITMLIIRCPIEKKFPPAIAMMLVIICMYDTIIVTVQAHPLPLSKP